MLRTVHVRQRQKTIHHAIRDITLRPLVASAVACLVRHPAPNLMVVRPVSAVVIYRPGQPGLMGPGRTRIPAIVITDVYVGTALKKLYFTIRDFESPKHTPQKLRGIFYRLGVCVFVRIYISN